MEKPTSNQASVTAAVASAAPPPTTFVQADAHSFRELVQKLTGVADDTQEKLPITLPSRYANRQAGGAGDVVGPRRPAFKLLHERRQSLRKLEIKLGMTSLRSPRSLPSPTATMSELLIPSPVTPLGVDSFENGFYSPNSVCFQRIVSSPCSATDSASASMTAEEKAIAEKGFYLHPSPRTNKTSRGPEPQLLPLFPLESPRQQQSSATK